MSYTFLFNNGTEWKSLCKKFALPTKTYGYQLVQEINKGKVIHFVNMQMENCKDLKEISYLSTKWKRPFYDHLICCEIPIQWKGLSVTEIISCKTLSYELYAVHHFYQRGSIKRISVFFQWHKHIFSKPQRRSTAVLSHYTFRLVVFTHITPTMDILTHSFFSLTVRLLSGRFTLTRESWRLRCFWFGI